MQAAILEPKIKQTGQSPPEDSFIKRYRAFVPNATPIQEAYAREVFNLVMNDTDSSTVTVSAGRCGIGKSMIVQSLISWCTQDDQYKFRGENCIPAIVVTDMLKRLNGYQDNAKEPPDNLCWYYKGHEEYCAYISSEDKDTPIIDQLKKSIYKPIVLLSTQRYFSMSDEQREMLFTYRVGRPPNQKVFRREIVIMDEKPYFYEPVPIKVKNINDCDTALREGIPRDDKDKDWITTEYAKWLNKMFSILRDQERNLGNNNTDIFYWRDPNSTSITSSNKHNDEQFFEFIEKHSKQLMTVYSDVMTDFKNFKKLMTDGVFFISTKRQSDQEYNTQFQLIQDNRDKFYLGQNKAKFFVLDGTADIDLDYNFDYINVIDSTAYHVPLDLTIKHIDVGTSRSNLISGLDSKKMVNAINSDIADIANKTKKEMLVAAYKKIEKQFSQNGIITGHFGGLKGLNNFMTNTQMAHVGFNRAPDDSYLITYLVQHPDEYKKIQQMNENDSRKEIKSLLKINNKGNFINNDINQIMLRCLLTDFEQNIFRTAIRCYDNTQHVTVYTYWNCNGYAQLNELISDRYTKLGTEIISSGVPESVHEMKTMGRKTKDGSQTIPQKVISWIDQLQPREAFTLAKVRAELKLTTDEIKNAKKNKLVKARLNKYRIDSHGNYMVS